MLRVARNAVHCSTMYCVNTLSPEGLLRLDSLSLSLQLTPSMGTVGHSVVCMSPYGCVFQSVCMSPYGCVFQSVQTVTFVFLKH